MRQKDSNILGNASNFSFWLFYGDDCLTANLQIFPLALMGKFTTFPANNHPNNIPKIT